MSHLEIETIAAKQFAAIVKNNPPLEGTVCPLAVYKNQNEFESITGESITVKEHRQIVESVAKLLTKIGALPTIIEVSEKPFFVWLASTNLPNGSAARGMYVAKQHIDKLSDEEI